jgi:diguanylate cyclase (GGDEF)-like protein
MSLRAGRVFFALVFIFLVSVDSYAGPLVIYEGFGELHLSPALSVLEDLRGSLAPSEALSPARALSYQNPMGTATINLGYSRSAFWLKAPIFNRSDRELRCIVALRQPAIENVELYWQGVHQISGALASPQERAIQGREILFRIVVPPGASDDLLFRVRSDTSLNLSFSIFEEDRYRLHDTAISFIVCLALGALLYSALYNAFLALSLRDAAYASYTIVVLGILLNRLLVFGYFQYYLTPFSGKWNYISILLSTSLFTAAMAFFTTFFLSTRTREPILHRVNLALPVLVAANMIVLALDAHLADQISILLLILAAVVSILTGCRSFLAGYRPARYYLLAWVALFVIVLLYSMGLFHIVKFSTYNEEVTLLGTVAMAILMSLALADRISEMRRLLVTDRLTCIDNRAGLEMEFERMLSPVAALDRSFSIIITDIDHFKDINDQYGHQTGDAVLAELASVLRGGMRSVDCVGRWGGDEFLVLCKDSSREGTIAVAEKLRRLVEGRDFHLVGRITCSFGVGTWEAGVDRNELFRRADEALYRAKRSGRNCVAE